MKKAITSTLIVIIFFSCNSHKTNSKHEYIPLILKKINVVGLGYRHDNLEISGYEHYIAVENYNEEDWNNFIVDYADKYLDTCKTDLPIMAITFCKSFKYKPHSDSRDLKPLLDHAIVTISYTYETLYKKYPDISSITFWHNGKATYMQIETPNRAKDKGYYDSAGNRKTDFLQD